MGAAHWGRRAFAIDAVGEGGLRRLLALLDRLGDRAGAILAYEEFLRRLEAEGVEPAPETQALIAGIPARREIEPLQETSQAAAVDAFRRSDTGRCRMCSLPGLARAYDRWGRPDSAVAVYERYLATPEATRLWSGDAFHLGPAYERLGQLYEAQGDRARAAGYFDKFVTLWKEADPVLQPRVREARRRLEEIALDAPASDVSDINARTVPLP